MDSAQTPRAPDDPVAERTSPMVKQNPSFPTGFQARPQGPPPLSPRYPINNGSPGGPRPGGQQPRILPQHLESRSSVAPGGQFLQSRPPFVPQARPVNPQGNANQSARSLNPINTQNFQGPPRYPTAGSPGARPHLPNNFVGGPRPPVFGPNQSQQIHSQPRDGEIRSRRPPISPDSPGPTPPSPQVRFPFFPQNPDIRQSSPRQGPDSMLTSLTKNDRPLRDDKLNGQTSSPVARVRATIPQDQQRERMEVIDSRASSASSRALDTMGRDIQPDDSDSVAIGKRGPSPRAENGKDDDEDDDNDVVIDSDKENNLKSTESTPRPVVNDDPQTEAVRIDSPGSRNSQNKSSTPSPIPPAQNRDASPSKTEIDSKEPLSRSTPSPNPSVENRDSPAPDSNLSAPGSSPTPRDDKSGKSSRPASRLEEPKSPDHSINDDSADFETNETNLQASEPIADSERSDSRASGMQSAKSPLPPATPDNLKTLSVPLSASSRSLSSSKSPTSPIGSVKGFDDGQPRSLSPSIGSVSEKSSESPTIRKSAEGDRKRATFADDAEIPQETNEPKSSGEPKIRPATPGGAEVGVRPLTPGKVGERAVTPGTPDGRKSAESMKRSTSARSIKSDAGSEGGRDETNQSTPTTNGVTLSPTKKLQPKPMENGGKRTTAGSPVKSPSKSVKSLPRTPEAGPPSTAEKKKVPMNKVQVGAAPSPNLKTVRSKIGSLDNASYKPGGGKIKIENRKLDFSKAQPKIAAKNDKYTPSGGDKKITQVKLQWNAKPKVGSLDNATYKPGGGDKKIETVKLDFKDKAKPKVGSKDNAKHVPGGGTVKSSSTPPKTPQDQPNDIETQKIDIKAESKIGSLENVKHKPGGGDKKIFNDKDYLRQTGSNVESVNGSGAQSPVPPSSVIGDGKNDLPTSDENLNEEC